MNRREAIAAIATLPGLKSIERADLKPDDVIVLECDKPLTLETCERIKAHAQEIWPDRQVVVLADGLRMKVVRNA